MSLLACISRCPSTTRWPGVGVRARGGERLQHGCLGLLDLQEERIARVAAEQERDPGLCADAAYAHHLVREIDQLVVARGAPGDRPAASRGSHGREAVEGGQRLLSHALGRGVHGDDGAVGFEMMRRAPSTVRVSFASASVLSRVRALATSLRARLRVLGSSCGGERRAERVDVDPCVPDVEAAAGWRSGAIHSR